MRENFPPLYVILDNALLGDSLVRTAQTLAGVGVKLVQLRNKEGSARATFVIARQIVHTLSVDGPNPAAPGLRLIINDRPDIAAMVSRTGFVCGAHVGQDDIAPDDVRILCPPPMWVGVSTHTLEQVREADGTTADYVAFGPIFHTTTKLRPDPVTGLNLLREARQLTGKPLVAIGGITAENAAEVFAAGVDCVAVVRDITAAHDAGQRARKFLEIAAAVQRN
jgi:thiamine-phosphate pyrophosphorylase